MRVLLATDADWLRAELVASLGGPDTSFAVCRDGRDVATAVKVAERPFDIGIFDLQIGSMGGMAVTMSLRLDESGGTLAHVPILMLLDRTADVHLARRSGADGWMIKPVDSLRLRRAMKAITSGRAYHEGEPVTQPQAAAAVAPPDEPTHDAEAPRVQPDPTPAG